MSYPGEEKFLTKMREKYPWTRITPLTYGQPAKHTNDRDRVNITGLSDEEKRTIWEQAKRHYPDLAALLQGEFTKAGLAMGAKVVILRSNYPKLFETENVANT